MPAARLAALSLALATACQPVEPDEPDGSLPLDGGLPLELGRTVDGGFAPLPDTVLAVPGAQGGFHVELRYHLPRGPRGRLTFSHEVRRQRDGRLASRGTRVFQVDEAPWTSALEGIVVFLCPAPLGVNLVGERLRFAVVARDAAGALVASGTAEAVFSCSDVQTAFCQDICRG